MSGGECTCKNHMGTPKQQHASNAAALRWAMRRGLAYTGTARIYRCPTSSCWHVTTKRKKRAR